MTSEALPQVEWLLALPPREVQLEALRRSYYGYTYRDGIHAAPSGPRWLRSGPAVGWGHFMQMRLGKTAVAVNEFLLMRMHHGMKRMIVVAPNSFKSGWQEEIAKYGIIDLPVVIYDTGTSHLADKECDQAKGEFILVLNYEALVYQKTLDLLSKWIDKATFLTADESIKIKNPSAIAAKMCLEMSKEAGVTRTLTGLPMTQGPQDLYMQMRFAKRLEGVNFYAFRNRWCKMGGFKRRKVVGAKDPEKLKLMMDQGSFTAKRIDWGTPTKPEFYTVQLSLSSVQQKHYAEMDNELLTLLNGFEVSADQVITKLLKLQQISSGFMYVEPGRAEIIMPIEKTAKMIRLMEMMEEEVPGKAIVVYHYSFSGDALMEALKHYNPACIRSSLWMKRNGVDIEQEKKRFNMDPNCRVMVLQGEAGKYGHYLAGVEGDRCETMIFYENNYSLDTRQQIEMRPTAIGQDWTSVYLDFVSSEVEHRAIEALAAKEDLVTAVMGAFEIDKQRLLRT